MRSILEKKGQVNNLGALILTLIFAAIVLVFGLVISQAIRDTNVVKEANSGTITNETVTQAELIAGTALDGRSASGASNFAIVAVYNNSVGTALNSGNYSLGATTGVLSNLTSEYSHTSWNVTYTYTYGDEAYIAGNESLVGLGTFADFWEIIVLAIVITVVIGLLLVVFGRENRR